MSPSSRGHSDLTRTLSGHQRRSREPSDVSVEALDLADYARTLRARSGLYIDPQDEYSRFPRVVTPRSLPSRESLVSCGNTFSTNTRSFASTPRPIHHPYSLPDTARIQSLKSTAQLSHTYGTGVIGSHEAEIDMAQFPTWSRNWYESGRKNSPPIYDPDAPPPARISIFNPSFKPNTDDVYPLPSYSNEMSPTRSAQHSSLREYHLPWSPDPLENGRPVNAETKEERIRMLEREFGQKAKIASQDVFTDEHGKPHVGTVNARGNLVTVGPRKRAAVRVLQILLALVAAVPSIYAALFMKSTSGTPPPAGKLAAYVLYALSIITTLVMLGLYVIRPCCCGRRKGVKQPRENPLVSGMMVLPVQGLHSGKDEKKKKGKKGGRKCARNDVQVNLIVDPSAFGVDDRDDMANDEEEPWNYDRDAFSNRRRRRNARRRSVFVGLAMEQEWERARSWAKKTTLVDVIFMISWGATFVLILVGKRCPSGAYDGWCNAYNTSSAAACLLCVAYGVSVFFDVKDLHDSKTNPRTRIDFS